MSIDVRKYFIKVYIYIYIMEYGAIWLQNLSNNQGKEKNL